ncbi:hypothetical protein [Enterococcus faecalis]|uniref:hypothetical protein n=1 Tax=Enterococcus faecalis TaxID=1351 RepID=UPI0040421900
MYVVFTEESNYLLPINKRVPLNVVDDFIRQLNRDLVERDLVEEEVTAVFQLFTEKGHCVYQSSFLLPKNDFSLLEIVREELESINNEEAIQFLQVLEREFEKSETTKRTEGKFDKSKPSLNIKKYGWVIAILLVLVLGSVVFKPFNSSSKTPENTYEQLIEKQQFVQAGKEYPERKQEIEEYLFKKIQSEDEPNLEPLKEFNKNFPSVQGDFDLAMLSYDYVKAIGIYKKNLETFKKDNDRLPLVGYSFLKEQNLKEAKEIAGQTTSPELEKYILEYEQFQLVIQEKEKQIKELQKKPTENKKKIEQAINELYEAKEKLNQL